MTATWPMVSQPFYRKFLLYITLIGLVFSGKSMVLKKINSDSFPSRPGAKPTILQLDLICKFVFKSLVAARESEFWVLTIVEQIYHSAHLTATWPMVSQPFYRKFLLYITLIGLVFSGKSMVLKKINSDSFPSRPGAKPTILQLDLICKFVFKSLVAARESEFWVLTNVVKFIIALTWQPPGLWWVSPSIENSCYISPL